MGSYLDDRLRKLDVVRPPIHRALVLGGDGVLGGAVLRELASRGVEARGLRRWQSAPWSDESGLVSWCVGEVGDERALEVASAGCDVMIWAAPLDDEVRRSVEGVRAALSVARGAELSRFVYVSSWATVGEPSQGGRRMSSEGDVRVLGEVDEPWHLACGFAELEVLKSAGCGLPAVVVNPTWWMGPGGTAPQIEAWVRACALGRVRLVPRGLANVVDVRDVAFGVVEAAVRGREGARYILGGHNISLWELAERIGRMEGVGGPVGRVSERVVLGLGRWSERASRLSGRPAGLSAGAAHQMLRGAYVSSARAQTELGFEARPLEETLSALAFS